MENERPDTGPSDEDVEKLFDQLRQRIEHISQEFDKGPTMEHVHADIAAVQKVNNFEFLGLVHPSGPCCNWTPAADVIAIFIHSKESQERIDRREKDVERLTPGFKTIVFCCYDMHRGDRTIIVQDMDSVMQLQNILGTAVARLKEREGPDPLEKLLS